MPHGSPEEAQIAALKSLVEKLRRRIGFIERSRFWKIRERWFALRAHFGVRGDPVPPLPPVDYAEAMDVQDPYARWLIHHEPRESDLCRLREVAHTFQSPPSICVVVDDASADASDAIDGVLRQAYPWVRLLRTSECSHGSDAAVRFNAALEACTEHFVAFCDPDEVLAPDASFEVAVTSYERPEADVIYGDRDTASANGRRSKPLFLPDWSPETFLCQMYTGRLVFYRRELVVAAGGFRSGFGTAAHYDLALRATERSKAIEHRGRIFYHEKAEQAGAIDKQDAAKAIRSALERRGEEGRLEHPFPEVDSTIVRYAITKPAQVEIILPTRDLPDFLGRCLTSIFDRSTYRDFRVNVIDNGSIEPATEHLLRDWHDREPRRFRVVKLDQPFNFSRLVNFGARSCDGPYLLLLNNDTEIITNDWIEAMVEQAQRPAIGVVGARLLYEDGSLQHAGVVVGLGELAGHVYRRASRDDQGPGGEILTVRNYSAVTAACMMVRRDVFEAVDGFDERLPIEFNDTDFCLRILGLGYRNVYVPHAALLHHESKTRGSGERSSASSAHKSSGRALFRERWQTSSYRDPYYNGNLTTVTDDGAIALP
ncbi:MAG TPA: glycosyltransferase family 2 protein [Candidatus Baltobacteraceae bacterium]|nr:glycosyltransferase family 2 protein [Candidatus Baltobacteraceae bacterium]